MMATGIHSFPPNLHSSINENSVPAPQATVQGLVVSGMEHLKPPGTTGLCGRARKVGLHGRRETSIGGCTRQFCPQNMDLRRG
ncbi:hypothetical protein Peur_032692 [Populus x canadensis]